MRLLSKRPIHHFVALTLCASFVSACSSSTDPDSSEQNNAGIASDSNLQNESADVLEPIATDGAAIEPQNVTVDSPPESEDDSLTTTPEEPEPDNTIPVVPDSLDQTTTQVNFEITVPAYQSNALQVELTWGDVRAIAAWIGDEHWSVSLVFPSDTEQLLTIIFSDNNGSLVLGSYEQTYKTGFNDAESLQITADQFNIDRWDLDEDGESNLAESIAGTDPSQNDTVDLEVRDSYLVTSVTEVSAYHEHSISSERPFSFLQEELPPADAGFSDVRQTHIVSIEIDASGNGVFSDNFEFREPNDFDVTTEDWEARRAKTENSVSWAGTYRRRNRSSQVSTDLEFSIETQSIDNQTSKQDGSVQTMLRGRGNLDFERDLSYSLVGEAQEDSPNCTPSSGTVTNRITNTRSFPVSGQVTVASKESADTLWSVRVTDLEGVFIEEYLARSLEANFYCDFTDL